MRHLILSLAASAALLALPANALAVTAPTTAHYSTAMTELYGGTAPYTGSLELEIAPDGIVRGYYFPADYSAMFVPVVGGKSGDSIWFDIGSSEITHVEGRLHNGVIVGTAFNKANSQYTFVAKPAAGEAR